MECFDHRNHVCLVFELLGASVFDFLKENSFTPFPMQHIQDFGRQLITSVACQYMSSHPLPLSDASRAATETDVSISRLICLRPAQARSGAHRSEAGKHPAGRLESSGDPRQGQFRIFALCSPPVVKTRAYSRFCIGLQAGGPKRLILNNPDIRLIDFGSATFEKEYHSTVVSTRHYRAPEIILGQSDLLRPSAHLVSTRVADVSFPSASLWQVLAGRSRATCSRSGAS